jgi:hypothetical protein
LTTTTCQDIPPQIYNLSQVKSLHITYEGADNWKAPIWSIGFLSPDICKMDSLENVYLSSQEKLREIPDEIFGLPNLKELWIGGFLRITAAQIQQIFRLIDEGVTILAGGLDVNKELKDESARQFIQADAQQNGGKTELGYVLRNYPFIDGDSLESKLTNWENEKKRRLAEAARQWERFQLGPAQLSEEEREESRRRMQEKYGKRKEE